MFNIEVHGEHVYFVGADGMLVHNSCPRLPANARTASIHEVYRRLEVYHGIPKHLASKRLHELKDALNYAPDDDLLFDLTGNIFNPKTRNLIGNLTDGGANAPF